MIKYFVCALPLEAERYEKVSVHNKMEIDISVPKKKNKTVRVLLVIFCVLLVAVIGIGVIVYTNIAKIWEDDLGFDKDEVVIEDVDENLENLPEATIKAGNVSAIEKPNDSIDIMLIGVDNRNSGKFTGRSDVMIYLRVNTKTKSIKMASVMRDTLVEIEGYGEKKLNSAYSYGSIDLMYNTYYNNLGLKPDYYMVVNFFGMEDIIDALGGVSVNIESSEELKYVNSSIKEINKIDSGDDAYLIKKKGVQVLDGRQAVAYMRTRHPGGDASRIKRQQTVLNELFKEAKNIGIGEIPAMVDALGAYVRTDIPLGTMIDVAKSVQDASLQTFRYPEEYENGYAKGAGSIVQPKDFETEYKKLNDFLSD